MVLGQPTARRHSLRLEPNEEFDAFGMSVVTDVAKAAGKALRVNLPCADGGPVAFVDVPTGVHPPVGDGNPLIAEAVDIANLVGLIAKQAGELVAANRRHHRLRQLAAAPGDFERKASFPLTLTVNTTLPPL